MAHKMGTQAQYTLAPPVPFAPYPQPQAPAPARPWSSSNTSTHTVRVTVLTDPDASVAQAVLTADSDPYQTQMVATGSARRTPSDKPDPEIGRLLAMARALRKTANRLETQANRGIRQAAQAQEVRAARSATAKALAAKPNGKHHKEATKKKKK